MSSPKRKNDLASLSRDDLKKWPDKIIIMHLEAPTDMTAIPLKEVLPLIRVTVQNWLSDRAPRLGAALAFYMALSLAPTLVILLAVAGLAFSAKAVEARLILEVQGLVGGEGAEAIQAMIQGAHRPRSGVAAILLGLVPLFIGATAAVSELKDALNTIWRVPDDKTSSTARSMFNVVKERFLSFAVVLGAGLFLLIVNAGISAAGQYLRPVALPKALIQSADWVISFVVITILFGLIFKVLPNVSLQWGDVIIGAVLTSFLFTVGKSLLGVYLGKAGFADSYGAAGSLVILLVWVYYSAQVLFFGAEFTRAYTCRFGSIFAAQQASSSPNTG
jgi:membrane protein